MLLKCSILLASLIATAGAKFPTNPSGYGACRYFYVTDEMNCMTSAGEEHTWPNRSNISDPRIRANRFKKDARDQCWTLTPGNKIPNSILFAPTDCTGD